jgi:hypothetical protein
VRLGGGGNVVGVLGEFFAATTINDTLVEDGPFGRYDTVTAKTVSAVSIATLGVILEIGTYDEVSELVDQGLLAEHGEMGIDAVPPSLRDALASETDLAGVANRWHDTDEMRDWPNRDVVQVVTDLAALARRARSDGMQLWFWWSL